MAEVDHDTLDLLLQIQEEKAKQKTKLLKSFIPEDPSAVPFEAQIQFLRDSNKSKLMRCGNRAAKTFTAMRDLAWKLTRSHWYRQDWNALDISKKNWKDKLSSEEYEKRYLSSPKKVMWIIGPTYEFVNGVMWGQYLKNMIPEWFIKEIKYTNQKNIDKIIFRNGDVLACKTYSQQDTTKMGYALHAVYADEMGTDQKSISELMVRLFDKDGEMTMGFTPLVDDPEFVEYMDRRCESGILSLHSWSVMDNPLYRDNPERLERVLEEYKHLPEHEKWARIRGDWFIVPKGKAVFEGVSPIIVKDFPVPTHWRRARVADPAAHVTGYAEFAEDPSTGYWYCILSREITWGVAAKAEDILREMETHRPYEEFRYCLAIYDNSEAWFGAYGTKHGFRPCIEKNREAAIQALRTVVGGGELRFFESAAAGAVFQMKAYHFSPDGTTVVKKKDHMLDCVMYFCRQKPPPLAPHERDDTTEHQKILAAHMQAKEAARLAPQKKYGYIVRHVQTLRRRGVR